MTRPLSQAHLTAIDLPPPALIRAAARGLGVSLKFFPWTDVPDLAAAVQVVTQAGPDTGILVASLHFDRSVSSVPQLIAICDTRLRLAHLCDVPVSPPCSLDDLLFTARDVRLAPGKGQIDLVAFINALPPTVPIGLEVPMSDLNGPRQ